MDYPERRSGWFAGTVCDFWTTIKLVYYRDLSDAARKLVGYNDYKNRMRGDLILHYRPASPEVWPQYTRWLRDGDAWYVKHDCDPRVWAAWRFPPLVAPPPPPGFDDDD